MSKIKAAGTPVKSVPLLRRQSKMRLVLPVLAATLLMGCGDKDEDTAEDTAASADTAVE